MRGLFAEAKAGDSRSGIALVRSGAAWHLAGPGLAWFIVPTVGKPPTRDHRPLLTKNPGHYCLGYCVWKLWVTGTKPNASCASRGIGLTVERIRSTPTRPICQWAASGRRRTIRKKPSRSIQEILRSHPESTAGAAGKVAAGLVPDHAGRG